MMASLDLRVIWVFVIQTAYRAFFLFLLLSTVLWLLLFLVFYVSFDLDERAFLPFASGAAIISLFILLAGSYVWARLVYRSYRYELSPAGFRMEFGVLRKRYVTILYNRIQNVNIHRGLLERLLGLSTVHIETAGASTSLPVREPTLFFFPLTPFSWSAMGGKAESVLPGLSTEEAERVRDELMISMRQGRRDQGV